MKAQKYVRSNLTSKPWAEEKHGKELKYTCVYACYIKHEEITFILGTGFLKIFLQ